MRIHLPTHKNIIISGSIAVIGIAAVFAGDVIVPGSGNTATGLQAVVVSGNSNTADGMQSAIVGGSYNLTSATRSGILSGTHNTAGGYTSGILSGGYNDISGSSSAIASGSSNEITGSSSFQGAGSHNYIKGSSSAILDGYLNTISANGRESSILAGRGNVNGGVRCSVLGGHANTLSGTNSVASGYLVTVENNLTFAHGREITIEGQGVTLFSDNDPNNERTASDTLTGSWTMYGIFENGYQFFTDSGMMTGAQLMGGATAWSAMSDRDAKCEFDEVDAVDVLKKVAAMPMTTWSYKHDDEKTRYMGVMAQDLHGAFGLGHNDKTINTLVADGVAMAAIQGLNTLLEVKDAEIEELQLEVGRLKNLEEKIANLEKAIGIR